MSVLRCPGERRGGCGEVVRAREASDLRGEAKIHLDRANFSEGSEPIRPRILPRRRIAASAAQELRNGAQGCRRPKKSEEGNSSAFFT